MELIDAPLNAWMTTRAVVITACAAVACPEITDAG
jgi:hypothetical protein